MNDQKQDKGCCGRAKDIKVNPVDPRPHASAPCLEPKQLPVGSHQPRHPPAAGLKRVPGAIECDIPAGDKVVQPALNDSLAGQIVFQLHMARFRAGRPVHELQDLHRRTPVRNKVAFQDVAEAEQKKERHRREGQRHVPKSRPGGHPSPDGPHRPIHRQPQDRQSKEFRKLHAHDTGAGQKDMGGHKQEEKQNPHREPEHARVSTAAAAYCQYAVHRRRAGPV